MRLLNSAILLVILCGGIHLIDGDELKCQFEFHNFDVVGKVYTCLVKSLDINSNNRNIDLFTGVHKPNNNSNDVKAIYLQGTNTKYIPTNIGSLFKITAFRMWNAKLIEIKTKDFHGMENLEYLDFGVNKLSSLPADAFITLPKLKQIYLYSNLIKELPFGLFSNNLQLEGVHLDKNQIKFIDSGLFSELTKLNNANMDFNICVHKGYTGAAEITQLKKDIKLYCNIPNDSLDLKLNQMIKINSNSEREMKDLITKELKKVKDEDQNMMKQLLNAIDVEKTNRFVNNELRTKLSGAMEQQLKTEISMNKINDEKAALKKEIVGLKKELLKSNENQQKKTIEMTKVTNEVNNLSKEVFELKQKHQSDNILFGELRAKLLKANEQLMTANEQLANCIID